MRIAKRQQQKTSRRPARPTAAAALAQLLACACVVCAARPALAHDTGFGHSRRTLLVSAEPGTLALEYRITAGPEEALVEMTLADRDGDGQISDAEQDDYFSAAGHRLAEGLAARTEAGKPLPTKFKRYTLNNGLTQTYRFEIPTDARVVLLEDNNFLYKPGQVRVLSGPGAAVVLDPAADASHADWVRLTIRRSEPVRSPGR